MSKRVMEFHSSVTRKVIEAMENTDANWIKSWIGDHTCMPSNATTNQFYRGINVLHLWCVQQERGYTSSKWATFKQWRDAGYTVRKGETAKDWNQQIIKVGQSLKEQEDSEQDDQWFKWSRLYWVFNADQIEDYVDEETMRFDTSLPNWFDAWVNNLGVQMQPGAPAFIPSLDTVTMPPPESFEDWEHYCHTASHEFVHWSGGKPRLDRDLKGRFDKEAYAMEELVAELGAAMLSSHFNIDSFTTESTAKYLNHWVEVLKKDNRAILHVASKAGDAVTYLLSEGGILGEREKELAA